MQISLYKCVSSWCYCLIVFVHRASWTYQDQRAATTIPSPCVTRHVSQCVFVLQQEKLQISLDTLSRSKFVFYEVVRWEVLRNNCLLNSLRSNLFLSFLTCSTFFLHLSCVVSSSVVSILQSISICHGTEAVLNFFIQFIFFHVICILRERSIMTSVLKHDESFIDNSLRSFSIARYHQKNWTRGANEDWFPQLSQVDECQRGLCHSLELSSHQQRFRTLLRQSLIFTKSSTLSGMKVSFAFVSVRCGWMVMCPAQHEAASTSRYIPLQNLFHFAYVVRDVSPRVCVISFFVRPTCLTEQRENLKFYSCPILTEHHANETSSLGMSSQYSRWNRLLWVWMVRRSPPQRSSAFFLSWHSYHALWTLMNVVPYLRTCCAVPNSLTPSNQRNVRHFLSNLHVQLWLKSQTSSLVIRSPWDRLVNAVSLSLRLSWPRISPLSELWSCSKWLWCLLRCISRSILKTRVLESRFFFQKVALLLVLVFPRHVHIFEVRIDWLAVTVMQSKYVSLFHLS